MIGNYGILAAFGSILFVSFVASVISHKIHIPGIVLYILSGLLLGRFIPGVNANSSSLSTISDIGVALLLFTIGMELPVSRLFNRGKEVVVGSLLQLFVTTCVLFVPFILIVHNPFISLALAVSLSFSSTAIVAKLISERGEETTSVGDITIGVLLVQDLISVFLITALSLLSTGSGAPNPSILFTIGSIGGIVLFFIGVGYVLQKLSLISTFGLEESTLLTFSLLFISFWLFEQVKLPLPSAGFLLGLLLGTRLEHLELFSQVRVLRDILLVVFFFMLGMSITSFSLYVFLAALCIALILLCIKFLITSLVFSGLRMHPKHAFGIGFDLMQCGEFGFVIVLLLYSKGFLTFVQKDLFVLSILFSILIFVVIDRYREECYLFISTILKKIIPIWPKLSPYFIMFQEEEAVHYENHLVLCGYGRVGSYIGHALQLSEIPFVVIDTDVHHIQHVKSKGIRALYGDAGQEDVLRKADIQGARFVVVAVPGHLEQEKIILTIRRLNPKAVIIARSHLLRHIRHLKVLGIKYIVHPEFEASLSILKRILKWYNTSHDDIKKHIHYLKIEHGMGEE